MERQRDEDAKESTICHSTRSLPPAQDRLPGPGGCSAAGCYPPGLWLWPALSHHPLTLTNMELEVLAGSECTGFNLMPRATLLTAHHCPWPRAQGEPVRAGGWQVQGTSVLLGGQEDCTQSQQPLLSAPEPPVCLQLTSSTTRPHFTVYWDTAWSRVLSSTWHSSMLVQGG